MSDPRTIFEWIDQSQFPQLSSTDNAPVFIQAFTADKGPEEMLLVDQALFNSYYGGDISFAKHGQPLLQAARIVNSGGRVLAKRLVASDSELANIVISLEVSAPGLEGKTKIGVTASTIASATDVSAVEIAMNSLLNTTGNGGDSSDKFVYPLFAITDNGRGVSEKRIRISPNYDLTARKKFVVYTIDILEKGEVLESFDFTLVPGVIDGGASFNIDSVINSNSLQTKAVFSEIGVTSMYEKLATATGRTVSDIQGGVDVLFAKTRDGKKGASTLVEKLELEEDSTNTSAVNGLQLQSGTNGAFGNAPIAAVEQYKTAAVKFFSGSDTDEIYDLVNHQVWAIIDANYPAEVKRAIEGLVTFREDCMFFRDLGLGATTIEGMKTLQAQGVQNKFCTTYHLSYSVVDPYSMKRIPVTVGYSLASLLVTHFINGVSRPLAGQLYGFVLNDAIEGTVNFIPRVTPSVNQREELGKLNINYASYYGKKLVLETQFTSSPETSQFSYTSNILAIQEVMRDIRQRCPIIRYSYMDGASLEEYKEDVQRIINKYTDNFREITFEYIEDEVRRLNKQFYAAIKVKFRDYVESEYFKIYALR